MYISDSTRENLTYKNFFEDEGYKKYVFILVGDKAKKGDRPTDIWALLDNTTVEDDSALVYWVTGVIAGCEINRSNTNKTYDGEYTVNADYTQAQLENSIDNGEFILHKVGDEVRVLVDINSLVDITSEKGEEFKSNQTIRVLDQIASDVASVFNSKYLGKIANNEAGRTSLWADIVALFKDYQTLQAIENFEDEDIKVAIGNDKKSVTIETSVQVINAMEKLYMTVVVE